MTLSDHVETTVYVISHSGELQPTYINYAAIIGSEKYHHFRATASAITIKIAITLRFDWPISYIYFMVSSFEKPVGQAGHDKADRPHIDLKGQSSDILCDLLHRDRRRYIVGYTVQLYIDYQSWTSVRQLCKAW